MSGASAPNGLESLLRRPVAVSLSRVRLFPFAMAAGLLGVLLLGQSAHAELDPVVKSDLPKLVAKKARVHLVRPCEVQRQEGGDRARLVPGDRVRAVDLPTRHGRPVPNVLEVATGDARYLIKHECLSKRPVGYTYRGEGSFQAFVHGLVADLPHLMEQWVELSSRHGYYIPASDPTGALSPDWQRSRAIQDHLQWVRSQLFKMAYSGRTERSVLRDEADWILKRGEVFIRGFSGGAPPEDKARLKKIYLLLNRLSNIPEICGKIARLQAEMQKVRTDKYQELEKAHRLRLIAEDIAKLQTELTRWQQYVNGALLEARTGMARLGIAVR